MNECIGAAYATANEGDCSDFDPDGSIPQLTFDRQLARAGEWSESDN